MQAYLNTQTQPKDQMQFLDSIYNQETLKPLSDNIDMNPTLPMSCQTSSNFSIEHVFNQKSAPKNAPDLDELSKIDIKENFEGEVELNMN